MGLYGNLSISIYQFQDFIRLFCTSKIFMYIASESLAVKTSAGKVTVLIKQRLFGHY